jgi:hypothetical protein
MIDRFLNSSDHSILVATKGMGKTLLMRTKRKVLKDASVGNHFIPRELEYDEPQLFGDLPRSGLNELNLWTELWIVSVILSILTHRWKSFDSDDNEVSNSLDGIDFPKNALADIKSDLETLDIDKTFIVETIRDIEFQKCRFPSYFLSKFLEKSVGAIKKFQKSIFVLESLSLKYITNTVYVFVDAFDQALTKQYFEASDTPSDYEFEEDYQTRLEIWRDAQQGLAKAVHRLNSRNRHIKVIASIRQEAFAGFNRDDREVIKGISYILEYSRSDLKTMFNHAINRYTECASIAEFLNAESVHNEYCRCNEDLFDYIYRHSASTPRSIMYFGRSLHDRKLASLSKDEAQHAIRKVVNATGSENLYEDYLLGQKRIFLSSLRTLERIQYLFSLIPSNVLTWKALKSINAEFSKKFKIKAKDSHPFCELFNIGLVGVVKKNMATNIFRQDFKRPYQFNWSHHELIHKDMVYLIHPGLNLPVSDQNRHFCINPRGVVGYDCDWNPKGNGDGMPTIFISYSSLDSEVVGKILPKFAHQMNLCFPVNIWFDKWSLKIGEVVHQEIERSVAGSELIIVFLSASSLKSPWVEKEWRTKHEREISSSKIQVIPIIIDSTMPSELPEFLRSKQSLQIPKLKGKDFKSKISRLCKDVVAHIENGMRENG